jgi:hypothetical protein
MLVLYRPGEQKIISIVKSSKLAPRQVRVHVSGSSARVDEVAAKIQQALGEQVYITKGLDKVQQSVVVDMTGSQSAAMQQVAVIVGIPAGTLPAAVSAPEDTVIAVFIAG